MRRGYFSKLKSTAALLIQLLAMTQLCSAQPPSAPQPASLPGGVEIKVQAQPLKATVGDPIQIDLDIALPTGYQATLPRLGSQLGDFAILQYYPGPDMPTASGPQSAPPAGAGTAPGAETPAHHRARIVAVLYKTGDFDFPPVEVALRAPDGKKFNISSRPVKIQIQSLLDKDPQLKVLKKQAEIQEPVRWLLWLTLAFLLITLAALAWWLYQRRRHPAFSMPSQPKVDPLVLAEADLRALIGRGLLESGFVKQFYVILSDIIKRILEAGYGLQTVEKTTSEIMQELHCSPAMAEAAENLERIESALFGCDLVKFAKYLPSRSENDDAVAAAFQILDSVKKLKSASAVAGQAAAAGVL
jgi:hypothetical protein